MDVLSNLNKNIFGENRKHASDSIDFSAQKPQVQKKEKIFEPKSEKPKIVEAKPLEEEKTIKDNNKDKNDKNKDNKNTEEDVSYSTYNKKTLKNISDPLSQMRPNSNFGYPTQKKEKKETPKPLNNSSTKNSNNSNNSNISTQKSKEAVMTGLFGDYNNINEKSRAAVMTGLFGDYSNINVKNKNNNTNITNSNNNITPNPNINPNINMQLNANMMMNYMNLVNMQQNMILNMYKNNQNINNVQKANINQNQNKSNNNINNKPNLKKNSNLNTERNELGQVYKVGDFYSDTNLIRENLDIMKAETIKDISKATLNSPEKKYMGILVLTDFRLIFKMENEKYLAYNYSEDYFKIPLFQIVKIEKVQDKKMSFTAIPIEITLKDTRIIKFHLYDLQRFYYNLCDATNPIDYKQFYDFPKKYNQIKFQGKNVTNGWNIYNPEIEFSRQGVTEDNDLGLRYCHVNKNFKMCATYPEFLVEPSDITDEELKQTSSYRTKGRIPIFSYYYNGNINSGLKVTPSIWRSAQNKRGLMGNKSCTADVKLLNSISKLGGENGKLYIFDCRPKLNAFVNRVGGGGYEKEGDYDNASLQFCEIDNIHKARKALNSIYSLCLSNKINDFNNFWTNLEQSGWFQFIYLMLKNANDISKTLQSNHSVLIHCSDGWDRTAQLSSLSQMLLDPFYRTINGFAVLVEKDWLSFGHQFGLRNGFSEKEKQDQASPIFLQFLDAVHQLLEQFPNAFEFNEKFLLFLARVYGLNLYGTFLYNNDKERTEQNAKFDTASVWTEIFSDLKPYLNIYYDPNSVKILEPNYSYYNIKLWTSLFMENNIYLENKHFFVSDIDKSLVFKTKQEFFAYKKKEDESKYLNNQNKYDELLKLMAETYMIINDDKIFEKLSKDSKKLIEELKPEFDKINKSRIMKKELVNITKDKKEDVKEEKKDKIKDIKINEDIKEEKKENKENKEEIKEEHKIETKDNDKKGEKIEDSKKKEEEINKEKEENKEDEKEENKEEKKEEKKEEEKAKEKKEESSIDKNENNNKTEDNNDNKEIEKKEREKKEENN